MIGHLTLIGRDYHVVTSNTEYAQPVRVLTGWRVLNARVTGPPAPELQAGLEVQYLTGSNDTWQTYRHGAYLILTTEHEGWTSAAPLPCPKVRAGVETRYRDGRWQKYLKARGWVNLPQEG